MNALQPLLKLQFWYFPFSGAKGLLQIVFTIASLGTMHGQGLQNFTAFGHVPQSVPDSLYRMLKESEATAERLNALYALGVEHGIVGNSDSVVSYANKMEVLLASKPADLTNFRIFNIKAKRLEGDAKCMQGVYDASLKSYLEGISISGPVDYDPDTFWLKLGMATVYLRNAHFEKAEPLFTECLSKSTDPLIQAKSTYALGKIAAVNEDYALSEALYAKAKNTIRSTSSAKFTLEVTLDEGKLFLEQKKYDTALSSFSEVMEKGLQYEFYDLYTEAVVHYGNCYIALGEIEGAEMILSMAYANALNWNNLGLQRRIVDALRKLYAGKGDFENAYNLMTQYNAASKQIQDQENTRLIRDLEYKYQTLEKENKILALQETQLAKQTEIERQKTIKKAVLYGFLAVLIPIIALLYVYYQKLQTQSQLNLQQKELNNRKISSLLNEQELKLAKTSLQAQQDERIRIAQQLHDGIGGNLAGIKLQLSNVEGKSELQQGIMKQVNETYELVRDISHDLVPKKFIQNAFPTLIKAHLAKIAEHAKLAISVYAHPEEKIDALPETLKVELFQIIQELTTNTIKHANANTIELHLNYHEGQLQMLFEDDGAGFDTKKTATGIGLDNLGNRVKQMEGKLTIDSSLGRGTVITITLNKEL